LCFCCFKLAAPCKFACNRVSCHSVCLNEMKHIYGDLSLRAFEKKPHVFIVSNSIIFIIILLNCCYYFCAVYSIMLLAWSWLPLMWDRGNRGWHQIGEMAQNLGSGTGYPYRRVWWFSSVPQPNTRKQKAPQIRPQLLFLSQP